jgi:magnesium transporter
MLNPGTDDGLGLDQALDSGKHDLVVAAIEQLTPSDLNRVLSRLSPHAQSRILELLQPEKAARLLGLFDDRRAADLITQLPVDHAAAIVEQLPSSAGADVVSELSPTSARAILDAMNPRDAAQMRRLVEYRPDSAGGLMITEVLAYSDHTTMGEVVEDLRRNSERYADYQVQYIYVVTDDRRLIGVLKLRDLLLGHPEAELRQVMIVNPIAVDHHSTVNEIKDVFDRYPFLGIPVVADDRLVGLVRRAAVEEALALRAARHFRLVQGIVGGEELRTMPLPRRSARRLSWLSANIVLNVIAASVIVYFEDTLARVIALAAFLPIISDMSGCSGNQAVAVSMRELTLGAVRPTEVGRVFLKEVFLGLLNGVVLGALLGAVAWLWRGNPVLGAVVGLALTLNTVVAVSIGGVVPLLLRRLGFDPALASGPILTTVTDICGFLFALGFATLALQWLGT